MGAYEFCHNVCFFLLLLFVAFSTRPRGAKSIRKKNVTDSGDCQTHFLIKLRRIMRRRSLGDGRGRGRSAAGAQGMDGGVNGSSNLNDGSGPGMSRDCDGVRIGSVSECLGVGSDGVQRSLTFGGRTGNTLVPAGPGRRPGCRRLRLAAGADLGFGVRVGEN
jgi:hypothetical protein